MPWIYLILAGLSEIVWAATMKASQGFARPSYTVLTVIFLIVSIVLLTLATKHLPLGTCYAIWTGIGVVGTVIWGMVYLNEPRDMMRIICVLLILLGIVGLKLHSPAT